MTISVNTDYLVVIFTEYSRDIYMCIRSLTETVRIVSAPPNANSSERLRRIPVFRTSSTSKAL